MKLFKNTKGTIFLTILVIVGLISLISVVFSNMILQDLNMIKHLRYSQNAQLLAEGGINEAMGVLVSKGFSAAYTASNFPERTLADGTYDVTVVTSGTRVLLKSVGTYKGVSRTVSCEIHDLTPTSLYYMLSAGNNLKLRAFLGVLMDINGDIHSNAYLYLTAAALGFIDISSCTDPTGCCSGDVSACTDYIKTTGLLGWIHIAGTVTDGGAGAVTFPSFNFVYYKTLATASGTYYSGDQTFGAYNTTTSLTSSNDMTYVEGTCTLKGTVNLTGGLVADNIIVYGRLNQVKGTHNRNVIISRTGDIQLNSYGSLKTLTTEEALVYSGRDFTVLNAAVILELTGTLIAARNLSVWDFLCYIVYNHRVIYPDGLTLSDGGYTVELLNWTR